MVLADAIGDIEDYVYTLWWLALLVLLYFLPTIVAKSRGVTNFGSIAIINVFLGWTFIGWVIALAMAFKTAPPREVSEVAAWRNCPTCNRSMDRTASVCPHCHARSAPWIEHADHWWMKDDNGAWHWLDEKANIWRTYDDGTPSDASATDRTASYEIDPALVLPPGTPAQDRIEEPAARHSPAPSAELERLAGLHERGILTDDEFQRAKQRVLGD